MRACGRDAQERVLVEPGFGNVALPDDRHSGLYVLRTAARDNRPVCQMADVLPQRDQSQAARQAAHGCAPLPEARIPTPGTQRVLPYAQERGLRPATGGCAEQKLSTLRVLLHARLFPDRCDQPCLGPGQRLAAAQDD